jgi:hypothetical protein
MIETSPEIEDYEDSLSDIDETMQRYKNRKYGIKQDKPKKDPHIKISTLLKKKQDKEEEQTHSANTTNIFK